MCPALFGPPGPQLPLDALNIDVSELDDLLECLLDPEEGASGADMGHKPCSPATPAPQGPWYPKAIDLSGRVTASSPFALPELQSATPRAATPAPEPRRTLTCPAQEPYRCVSFRSLAPTHSLSVAPQRPQGQPQRAASCTVVPRVQPPAAPRTVSAGDAALVAPLSAVDSALAWAAGFSRLATQLGCAAPAPCGGLWDPIESSDILALLTLELSCCSHNGSASASCGANNGSSSGCGGSLPSSMSACSGRKRKASWDPAWPATRAPGSQRLRTCLPPSQHAGRPLF